MANIVIPFAAVAHQPVPSVGFNNNFTEVATKFNTYAVQTDVVKTISVSHNWLTTQTFPGLVLTNDLLFTDALYDIGKAGATRPRDLFLSRNLTLGGSVLSDLLFTDNTFDIGKNAATRPRDGFFARNLSAQGTLIITGATTLGGALAMNGDVTLNGRLFGTNDANGLRFGISGVGSGWKLDQNMSLVALVGTGKIIGGVTGLSHRNNADTADNVLITDAGNMTVRLGITAGGGITAPITATSGSFHATPSAADPAISTSDGDIWVLTTGALKVKLNGSVRTMWHSGMVSPGYAAWTGTLNRASVFDQSTATLANVAQRLAAIQNDLMTAGILST